MFWPAIIMSLGNLAMFFIAGNNSNLFLAIICYLGAAINFTVTVEEPGEQDHD